MKLPKLTRKRLIVLIGIVIGLPLLALVIFEVIVVIVFSSDGFALLPLQDCNGVPIDVSGVIYDTNRNPVDDAVIKVSSFDQDWELLLYSDESGQFLYDGSDSLFVFACYPVIFHVSADGFWATGNSYELFNHYSMDNISTVQPNPIHVEIILERSN